MSPLYRIERDSSVMVKDERGISNFKMLKAEEIKDGDHQISVEGTSVGYRIEQNKLTIFPQTAIEGDHDLDDVKISQIDELSLDHLKRDGILEFKIDLSICDSPLAFHGLGDLVVQLQYHPKNPLQK